MGGRSKKTYLPLANRPILAHTVASFDSCMLVDSIVVVVAAEDVSDCREMLTEYSFLKVRDVIAGGATRQQSVYLGLQRIPHSDIVIVHDGVRPFVTHPMLEDCVEAADQFGAATLGVPVKDTVKIASRDGFVQETLDRSTLWAIQTPQAFRYSLLLAAHQRADEQGLDATDDATLVEELGHPVKLVRGDYANLKITTPEDLAIAETLMQPTKYLPTKED